MKLMKFIFKFTYLSIKILLFIPVLIFSFILRLLGFNLRRTEKQLEEIDKMTGREFEEYACRLLKKNGFYQVHNTQESQDYGIDIIGIYEDEIFAIQCKKYKSTVGAFSVQEAFTGKNYYSATRSAVLTNSTFSKNAENLARSNEVFLWDRDNLIEMIEGRFEIGENELKK